MAIVFFHLVHTSEFTHCGKARIITGHSLSQVLFNLHLQVRLNFVSKVPLQLPLSKQPTNALSNNFNSNKRIHNSILFIRSEAPSSDLSLPLALPV